MTTSSLKNSLVIIVNIHLNYRVTKKLEVTVLETELCYTNCNEPQGMVNGSVRVNI